MGGPFAASHSPEASRVMSGFRAESWLITTTGIPGHGGVELEGGDADGEGVGETRERVLGSQASRAAMTLEVERSVVRHDRPRLLRNPEAGGFPGEWVSLSAMATLPGSSAPRLPGHPGHGGRWRTGGP